MGLRTLSVTSEIDHYKITIRSISDQYKITNFNRLHIPPKMFVDLVQISQIKHIIKWINTKYDYHHNQTSSMNENMAITVTN